CRVPVVRHSHHDGAPRDFRTRQGPPGGPPAAPCPDPERSSYHPTVPSATTSTSAPGHSSSAGTTPTGPPGLSVDAEAPPRTGTYAAHDFRPALRGGLLPGAAWQHGQHP